MCYRFCLARLINVFGGLFQYFWPCNFKKLYLCCYAISYKAIPHWKGQRLNFQKKNLSVSGNPWYSAKKLTRHISAKKKIIKFIKNVILPGNVSILCNMLVRKFFFFFQYLSKTTRKSFENIERLGIFYKFILRRDQIIIVSIMKFYTSASLVVKFTFQRHFVFSGFHRIIELKTSKHEFGDIIHQNKQGFDGKKLSDNWSEGQAGRNSLRFNNMCCRVRRIGYRRSARKDSYVHFRVCFACYPPESFKIICLTCIWLKFVDTSFHSSQKSRQINPESRQLFSKTLKNRCVRLKTPRGWN